MPELVLARDAEHVVNPRTGESLSLAEASTADLADARDALTVLKTERETALHLIDEEIVRRTDEGLRTGELATRTFDAGPYKLAVDSPDVRVYDSNALRKELLRAVDHGELRVTAEAIERLFVARQWYLYLSQLDRLAGIEPKLREVADRFSTPRRRTVKVTRHAIEARAEEIA